MADHRLTRGGDQGAPWPWDERYAAHPWPSEPDPLLVELVAELPPGKALDLGCGPGRNAIFLARSGWAVTGVDASAVGLEQAAERARRAGVDLELVHADLRSWEPPEASFDLVVVANLHPAPAERPALFAAAARALKPGGRLFIVGHHLDDLGRHGPPDPDRLSTERRVAEALFSGLELERLKTLRRASDAGDDEADVAVVAVARRAA